MWGFDDEPRKRTLGIRDKQIIYRNAKGRCGNPGSGKKIDFDEMQVGHKNAYSRGGATTFKNSVSLCSRCNKLQGTDSWATFLKKQGVADPKVAKLRASVQSLESMTISELKALAKKHSVKVNGTTEEGWFETRHLPPTKAQYVRKLSKALFS